MVQVIDTWFEARRLGLIFEVKVGGGKLLVCSMDITNNLDSRPVARQMRRSLLAYMASDKFDPETNVDVDAIRGLFRPLSNLEVLGATIAANSAERGYDAQLAMDGNPKTIWHTAWEPKRPRWTFFLPNRIARIDAMNSREWSPPLRNVNRRTACALISSPAFKRPGAPRV